MSKQYINIDHGRPKRYITVGRNGMDTGVIVELHDEDGTARVYIPDCVYTIVREAMDNEYNSRPTKGNKL